MSVQPPPRSNYSIKCLDANVTLEADDLSLIQDSLQLSPEETQVKIQQDGLYQKMNGKWQLSSDPARNDQARSIWKRIFQNRHNSSSSLSQFVVTHPGSAKQVIKIKKIVSSPRYAPQNLPRVSDKLLAFIHGDSFIKASGYEGGDLVENIEFLLNYLKNKPGNKLSLDTIRKLEGLVQMEKLHRLPRTIINSADLKRFHSAMVPYARDLSNQVAALPVGEKMLMRGGWLSSEGGHALVYIIEKLENGDYAFTVVNTGDGIDEHGSDMQGFKTKYRPILRYTKISAEKMGDPRFFQALLELRIPSDSEGKPTQHSPKDIYERILPTLGGMRDYAYENAAPLITTQKSGTCSLKVLLKLFQAEMDPADYKSFMFELKKDTLQSYFHLDFLRNHCSDEQIQLLQRSAQGFARYTHRQFEAELIDEIALEEAESIASIIDREIAAREQSLNQVRADVVEFQNPIYSTDFPSAPLISPTPLTTPGSYMPRVGLGPLEGLEQAPDTLSDLHQLMDQVVLHCTQLSEQGNATTAIETIKEMVKIIPLGSLKEEGYWKAIINDQPREAVEATMAHLLKLSELLFYNISRLDKKSRGSPEQFALMLTLTSINQYLSWQLGEQWVTDTNYSHWVNHPFAFIPDEKLSERLKESIGFLEECKKNGGKFEFRPHWSNHQHVKFEFTPDGSYKDSKTSFLKSYFDQLIQNNPKFEHLKGKSDRAIFSFFLPLIGKPDFLNPLSLFFTQTQLLDYFERNPDLEEISKQKALSVGHCSLEIQPSKQEELNCKIFVAGVESLIHKKNELRYQLGQANNNHPFYKHLTAFTHPETIGLLSNAVSYQRIESTSAHLSHWHTYPYEAVHLNSKQAQQIAYMLSKKETFVPHFLSYLKEHPTALQDRDFQLLIHYAFLNEDLLESSFKTFPSSVPKLVNFLKEQVKLYQKLGDIQSQLYFLELITCVNKCISKPEYQIATVDVIKKLDHLIKSIEDTSLQSRRLKALAYTQLISLFHPTKNLSAHEIIRLSTAYSYIQAHGYDSQLSHPFIKKQMEEVMNRVSNSPHMKDPQLQIAIVEGISKEVLRLKNRQWNGSFPIFYDDTHQFRVDLSTFSLFEGDLLIGGLPDHISKDPSFHRLFSNKNFQVRELATGLYTFTILGPPKNETYRVFTAKENHQVVIQRKQGNDWLTYISPEKLEGAVPKGLIEGQYPWILNGRWPSFQLTIEDDSGMPCAVVEGEDRFNKWKIHSCVKHPIDPKIGPLLLQDNANSSLSRFQEKGFFLNWGNRILEFPKARIHFRIDPKDGKAYFSDNAKLHLSKNQAPPKTLPLYRDFILVEDKEGNRHYLFPRESVKIGHGALKREIEVEHHMRDGTYFQIKEKQGQLSGSTPEENLFLAYLHICHKNYKEAYRLLAPEIAGNPKGYSEREERVLKWIFSKISEMNDSSPENCAIELQILHLSLRNLKKENQLGSETIHNALTKYYPMAHHLTSLSPSPSQLLELREACAFSPSSTSSSSKKAAVSTSLSECDIYSLARELRHLSYHNDTQTNALFSLNGSAKLALYFDRYFTMSLSATTAEREELIKELDLLKLSHENVPLNVLRQLLKQIASHPDQALRDQITADLKNTYDQLQNKLELLQKVEVQFNRPNAELEAPHREPAKQPHPLPKKLVRIKKVQIPELNFISSSQDQFAHKHIRETAQDLLFGVGIVLKEDFLPGNPEQTEELIADLAPNPKDGKATQKEFTRVQNSTLANEREITSTQRYTFTSDQLQLMLPSFQQRREQLEALAESHKEQILTLANTLPKEKIERLKRSLERLGKQREKLTLDDLIILYLQNNGKGLAERNPDLSQEQVDALTLLIQNYLIYATEAAHFKRLEKITEEALTLEGGEQEEALLRLDMTLREQRQYNNLSEDKVMLIFEYYSEKRLRKNQVELIRKMQLTRGVERQNLIAQLIMGSGKSKVIMVLLAYLNSDGERTPVIIVPDMLYETNLEDMRIASGENLHQSPYTFNLEKGASLDQAKLIELEHMIDRIKRERTYCFINESTIKTLLLQYNALIVSLGAVPEGQVPSPQLEALFYQFNKVMNKLLQDAILDEPDLILDYLKEMNLAHGDWTRVSDEIQSTLEQIMLEIASNKDLSEFFQLERESEVPFDPILYKNHIKPRLAQVILKIANLEDYPEDQRDLFLKYLLSDSTLKEVPPEIRGASRALRNQLSLGKELIARLFPFVLNNICNQNFGLSKERNSFQAIPFARKDKPNEGSEFSSPFVTMLFTTLYYARKGISADAIKKLISECKAEAIQQNATEGTPFKATAGFLRFAALNVIPGKDLFSIQDGDVDQLVQELNADLNKRIAFSRNFGWREIGSYNRRLSVNAQYIAGAFRWILGFTGTLGNSDSLPPKLNLLPEASTDGKVLSQIRASNPSVTSHENLESFYQSLANYDACIDTGAWFRGIPEKEVALRMLSHLPERMKGIVYFNDVDIPAGTKGQAVIIERGKEEYLPQLLSKSSIPEDERFSYFNVTTGADLSQHGLAKAIMTVGKNMLLRDFLQGAGRMRGLHLKQTIDFAIPSDLDPYFPRKICNEVFRLCTYNQAIRQPKDNLGSLKAQIAYLGESVVLEALRDPTLPFERITSLCRSATSLLAPLVSIEPVDLFEEIEGEVPIENVIASSIQDTMKTMRQIYSENPWLKERTSLQDLEESMGRVVRYDVLPEEENLPQRPNYGMQTQTVRFTETQTQNQVQTQLQQEILEKGEKEAYTRKALDLGNIFTEEYFQGPMGTRSVNDFLISRKKELTGFQPQRKVFSGNLKVSDRMGPDQTKVPDDKKSTLFQRGTMPVSTCALKIFADGHMEMVFVDPNEAEFLSLSMDLNNKPQGELREKEPSSHEEILMEELMKEIRELIPKEDLTEYSASYVARQGCGQVYDHNLVCQLLKENKITEVQRIFEEGIGYEPWFFIEKANERAIKLGIGEKKGFFDKRDFQLLLVDPKLGILKQGSEPVDEKELKNNPRYIKLCAQAKFYNGDLDSYTFAEREYLKRWIQRKGIEPMSILLSNILRARPADMARYPHSVLYRVFQSIDMRDEESKDET